MNRPLYVTAVSAAAGFELWHAVLNCGLSVWIDAVKRTRTPRCEVESLKRSHLPSWHPKPSALASRKAPEPQQEHVVSREVPLGAFSWLLILCLRRHRCLPDILAGASSEPRPCSEGAGLNTGSQNAPGTGAWGVRWCQLLGSSWEVILEAGLGLCCLNSKDNQSLLGPEARLLLDLVPGWRRLRQRGRCFYVLQNS